MIRTFIAVAIAAAFTLTAGTAYAHERPEYSPDDPSSWACQVDPDDPHRHPDEVCYDGHDPDDCTAAERDADGWCPEPNTENDGDDAVDLGPGHVDEDAAEVDEPAEGVDGPAAEVDEPVTEVVAAAVGVDEVPVLTVWHRYHPLRSYPA